MNHPLQCRCGTLKGVVSDPRGANRVVCYCRDCQAFAHFLGCEKQVVDERGGSDIIQTLPKNVTFTQGIESLACLRLTEKGMVRWYARCCNAPIGNTLATPRISFIGLVHTCLEMGNAPLDAAFGPVRAYLNMSGAKGDPKPKVRGQGTVIWWFITTVLKARINGDYKHGPFFRPDTGALVVTPHVLTSAEHSNVMNAVRAAGTQ
jgi:Family of unknown function (DUF6151)